MREAMFYKKLAGKTAKCGLCHRGCTIPDNGWGFCGTRQNQDGTLYAMNYGRTCSYAVDPIEKKPFFHFWPGTTSFSISTVGCNFRCLHCQNYEISQARPGQLPEEDLPPQRIVELAQENGCRGISYTYTEPTVFFEYAYDTGLLAKKAGLYNTFVTNGYMTTEAIKKAREFLDGARIDLKGDERHYLEVCGGVVLEKVLKSIRETFRTGMHVEIITLVIPGDNDNRDFVVSMAQFLKKLSPEIPWHFTRFYPTYKMLDVPSTPPKTLDKMHDWAVEEGMKYVYAGNVPGHKYENTYCPECGEMLLRRHGFEVIEVRLTEKKKCPKCGHAIPIVGDLPGS